DNSRQYTWALVNDLMVRNRAQLRLTTTLTLEIVWQLWRGNGYYLGKNGDSKRFNLQSLFVSKLVYYPYLSTSIRARAIALSVFLDIHFVVLQFLNGMECTYSFMGRGLFRTPCKSI